MAAPQSHLMPQSDDLCAQLKSILSHFHRVRYMFDWLIETQKLFMSAFQLDETDPTKRILPKRNQELVTRVLRSANANIPLFGPNNSGKSALINFLLGSRVMPSTQGHTTGRICVISGCNMELACVATSTLEEYLEGRVNEKSIVSVSDKDIKEIEALLRPLLTREDISRSESTPKETVTMNEAKAELSSATDSFQERGVGDGDEEWSRTIVHLRYPFELLCNGITLIDLPGTSSTDQTAIQAHLLNFIQLIRPPGLLFVYDNPTFADAEISAFRFLADALPVGDVDQNPSVFFINSKWQFAESVPYQNSSSSMDWQSAAQKNFEQISSRSLPLCHFSGQSFLDSPCRWAPISIHAFKRFPANPIVVELKEHFQTSFLGWLLDLQKIRYYAAHNIIAEACSNFFVVFNTIRDEDLEYIEANLSSGLQSLREFEDGISARLRPLILDFKNEILKRVKNESFLTVALSKARLTSLNPYDGQRRLGVERQAMSALQLAISPYIQELFVQPAIEDFQEKLAVQVEEGVQELLDAVKDNQVLLNGIRNCVRTTKVETGNFINSGYSGALLSSFVNTIMSTGVWAGFLLPLSSPVIGSLFISALAQSAYLSIVGLFGIIDPEWKAACAKYVIMELPKTIEAGELSGLADNAINQLLEDIAREIQSRYALASKARQDFLKAESLLPQIRSQFGLLESRSWISLLHFQGLYSPPLVDDEPVTMPISPSQTGFLPLITGTWSGRRVLIKRPKESSPQFYRLGIVPFFEFLHYSRCLARSNAPHILPVWSVYHDKERDSWCAITRPCQGTLRQLLNQRALPFSSRLFVLSSIAVGLSALHSHRILHRDLNYDTVMYDIPQDGPHSKLEIFLTDFGTRPDSSPIQGAFRPPELETSGTYKAACDIYSFGILASFVMLDLKAYASNTDSTGSPHWKLLLACQAQNPVDRPPISKVVEAITSLLKKSSS